MTLSRGDQQDSATHTLVQLPPSYSVITGPGSGGRLGSADGGAGAGGGPAAAAQTAAATPTQTP